MLSSRRVTEFLSGNGGGIHEPALGDSEDQHPLLVAGAVGGGVLFAATRSRRRARRAGARVRASSHRDRTRPGGKFERARLEFIECALVLEEDDLAVRLAA